MKILDVSAGNRGVWFNKRNPLCTFLDIRPEVDPDIVADSRNLMMFAPESFDLVVFDPPHVNFGANANLSKAYGHHTSSEIRDIVRSTTAHLWRVLKRDGLLAFKWNDHDQKLKTVLALMPYFEPLFGTTTTIRTKHASVTFWVLLRKRELPPRS